MPLFWPHDVVFLEDTKPPSSNAKHFQVEQANVRQISVTASSQAFGHSVWSQQWSLMIRGQQPPIFWPKNRPCLEHGKLVDGLVDPNLLYQAGFEGRYLTQMFYWITLYHIGSMFRDSQVNQTLANLTMFILVYGQKSWTIPKIIQEI